MLVVFGRRGGTQGEAWGMGIVVSILVGVLGLVGAVVLVAMAVAGRAAREGRGDGQLLVAPRGAEYGEATRMVLGAARAGDLAEVVHLHEHRARRPGSTHEAA
jgi:hypothetical protein